MTAYAFVAREIQPGDRAYRMTDGGREFGPCRVVRVNRVSVTIEFDDGRRIRVQPGELTPRSASDYGEEAF